MDETTKETGKEYLKAGTNERVWISRRQRKTILRVKNLMISNVVDKLGKVKVP